MALTAGLIALWIIRKSWRIPWERPAIINVACQTFKLAVVASPQGNFWLSSKLHTATGVWNLEQLIAAIGYMAGMFAILYLVAGRLDMSEKELATFFRYRIEIPGLLMACALIAVFVAGPGKTYIPDTIATDTTQWLRVYFLIIAVTLAAILVQIVQGLLIIRRDPKSRTAANTYLFAVTISAACIAAFQIEIEQISWVLIRVEVVAYAVAASYTWHSKHRADVPTGHLLPS